MKKNAKILIEGDYIDSFVYSGVLFLVTSDLILRAFSWDGLFKHAISNINQLKKIGIQDYARGLNDSIPDQIRKTYSISYKKIKDFELCSTELNVWPSDINIYKNRFYVASECGVDSIDFDWNDGLISKFGRPNKIFNEVSFKLATNSFYRLAIAAGNSGLISVVPDQKYVKKQNVNQLIDKPCSDCQWQNNTLIANTLNAQYYASYLSIPKKIDFNGTDSEYWAKVDQIKKAAPSLESQSDINGEKIVSSWFAGKNIFNITESMNVYLRMFGSNNIEFVDTKSEISTLQYFKAQTAPFGTVMEIGDELKYFSDTEESRILANEVVNWRLFQKSKYYLNHLHLIEDDSLSIVLFDMPKESHFNKFCYSKTFDIEE